ncbi:MAG: pilus assembly protein PilP [Desulfobulbaceae bacterium]|nr:pilus assembly protein PilP [Desulfobulbaceae bacterium]
MRQPEHKLKNKGSHLAALLLLTSLWIGVGASSVQSSPNPASGAQGNATTSPAAQGAASADKPLKKTLEEILQTPFAYNRENRSDPFMPFITEQTGPKQFAPEEDAPLTGMQLFEPSQLTLVTILFSGEKAIAMVEDSTGMGHIIKVKDKIGRRGEIKAIVPNAVIIEEWSLTTSGTKRLTTNEMVLRKEGDNE